MGKFEKLIETCSFNYQVNLNVSFHSSPIASSVFKKIHIFCDLYKGWEVKMLPSKKPSICKADAGP